MHSPIETQLEFDFTPPIQSEFQFGSTTALPLLTLTGNAVTAKHHAMVFHCNKTGECATLDFVDGVLVFKGSADGPALKFLSLVHEFSSARVTELYNYLMTYRGIRNVNGELLANIEEVRGLFPTA